MNGRTGIQIGLGVLLLAAAWLAGGLIPGVGKMAAHAASGSGVDYSYVWSEGANFTMVLWWNAQSQAGCDYAANPWPQAELASQRAYVLAARQVLRDEWDINTWISQNRAASSQARIHGTETACFNGHLDYPPHAHIFYLSIDKSGGWHHINSHHYPNATGQIYDNFVIPNLCGQNTSYEQPVNAWLNILDETCAAPWQQRYTTVGDIELRRSPTAPAYQLHLTGISGDLATIDVVLNGTTLYTVSITTYDPLAQTMVATIKDYRKNLLTTETWQGNPATGNNLASHTKTTAPLSSTPTPAPTATPSSTSTPTPTATATSTLTPTPTARPSTPTPTATAEVTGTPSPTPAPTGTGTPTPTAGATSTPTPTATPSTTPTTAPPTPTPTATPTATNTPAPTASPSATSTPAPTATAGAATTATAAIAASPDDGWQDGNAWNPDSTTLYLGDNRNTNASYAGLRFAGLAVPQGATIQAATLRVYSTQSIATRLSVRIYADNTGNSAGFASGSLPGGRTATAAYVDYSDPAAWAANTWYTIDVTPVVQAIVSRGDWTGGSALSLIAKGMTGVQGYRRPIKGVSSTDATNAAQLVVVYR